MDTGWTVFVVVLGVNIIGLTMLGILVKDTLKNKKRDDHFVKCIDMDPVATDPIPDEIWENIKEEEI